MGSRRFKKISFGLFDFSLDLSPSALGRMVKGSFYNGLSRIATVERSLSKGNGFLAGNVENRF